jgi:hypothetical protein
MRKQDISLGRSSNILDNNNNNNLIAVDFTFETTILFYLNRKRL